VAQVEHRIKILYHHRTLSRDGQDVHITELIRALRNGGHEVVIVSPPVHQDGEFGSDGGLVTWIKRRLPRAIYEILECGYSFVAYWRLSAAYRKHRPDILYERYSLYLLAGKWLKARYKGPMFLEVNAPQAEERTTHDGLSLVRFAHWAESTVWCAADHVLPVSDCLAAYVRAVGVPESRISVIPNGINPQVFSSAVSGDAARRELGLENKVVLGFTGFIRSWHGLTRVIDAMTALPDRSDAHFLVIGDGPGRQEIEDYARAKGVSDHVTMLGLVSRERINRYVAAFDIALQPSVVAYASPLKLFEYMALGRAIVAPDQANIREILTDGTDALLFDTNAKTAFTRAIMRLREDDALRHRLGKAAAQRIVAADYTWEGNARRVIELAEACRCSH
jgi:glycosyltransferase involved in cell wall biosynthesis